MAFKRVLAHLKRLSLVSSHHPKKKIKNFVQTHFVQSNCQRLLTVSSDEGFDALAPPLAESVHHEEQQREDEEGRDAADDESHPAGHGVKKAVSI